MSAHYDSTDKALYKDAEPAINSRGSSKISDKVLNLKRALQLQKLGVEDHI